MKAAILEGDVFQRLKDITPGSVDCVCCSPPYWRLRDYSTCNCVKAGKKRPGCTNCDDNGKVPVVRDHQLGMEKTPEEFVQRLVEVFRLVRECMSPWAVALVNIGDTYSQYNANRGQSKGKLEGRRNDAHPEHANGLSGGIPAGNLCLVPQRLALSLQADGWIVRSVIVFAKPSPMPSSVAGWRWQRCRVKVASKVLGNNKKSHNGNRSATGGVWEGGTQWADCPGCLKCQPNGGYVLRRGSWRCTSSWEPVLMLAKQAGYFADGESVKTPAALATVKDRRDGRNRWQNGGGSAESLLGDPTQDHGTMEYPTDGMANLRDVWRTRLADLTREELIDLIEQHLCVPGSLPDVWTIASEPLSEKHYAAFPTALVRQCLRAGTSAKGYCPTCGMPWCRILQPTPETEAMRAAARNGQDWTVRAFDNQDKRPEGQKAGDNPMAYVPHEQRHSVDITLGWRPTCSHADQEPRPGVVLDPFAGSGRTGLVARKLGLDFVGVELSPSYCEMARRLLSSDLPLFDDIPDDPEEPTPAQGDLFSGLTEP